MGSVFAQLLDTLPMHQAVTKIEQAFHPLLEASANDVRTYVRRLDKSSAHTQELPGIPGSGPPTRASLWGWRHDGDPPSVFRDVSCRVRDYGYEAFKAVELLELGMVQDGGSDIQRKVQIETTSGARIDLPLESRFVHSRFLVRGGYSGANSHWLWPLQAALDTGLVVAFAYELVRQGGSLEPQPYELNRDPESAAALEQLLGGSGDANWGERAIAGDFMPQRSRRHAPSREVGSSANATAQAPRVLVAVSFATFKERADFEPGGVAGFAKLFPHIMIKASIPLRSLRAAVKIKRPGSTTSTAAGSGTSHASCRGDSESSITPLMVADTNENAGAALQFGPFWSDIFAYYDDAWDRIGQTRMNVIKRGAAGGRRIQPYGDRRAVVGQDQDTLTKTARQGEFDSVHLAPSLRVRATHYTAVGTPQDTLLGSGLDNVEHLWEMARGAVGAPHPIPSRDAWHLDHVKMAPFCAHDCLHIHWRWGTNLSDNKRFVKGWSASAPYAVLGAPMVPPNHDVHVTLPEKNVFLYDVDAGPVQNGQIPAFAWQVIFHHGAGFVSGIYPTTEARGKAAGARGAAAAMAGVHLYDGTTWRDPGSSDAAFYWHLRYELVDDQVRERVDLTAAQLSNARRL